MLELYEWVLLGVSPLPSFVIGALFVLTLKHADKKVRHFYYPISLVIKFALSNSQDAFGRL